MDPIRQFSHDLRNVLGILYAESEALQMALKEYGTEEERELARSMFESAQRIEKMLVKMIDEHKD